MNIRCATPADAEIISALTVDVHALYATAQPQVYKPVTDARFAMPAILQRMADGNSHYYLVNVDGEDVGYAHARLYERPENAYTYALRYLYLEEISVRPDFRRRGCGEALMEAVRDLARELGVSRIQLDHGAFNMVAHAFFADQGFVTYSEKMWLLLTA
jgi:GNAT superfamily N-acetyltransferase